MDLKLEITNHLDWIDDIVGLLESEQISDEQLQSITRHDTCALGHWLNEEASQKFRDVPELEKLIESHAAFHDLAGKLITALKKDDEIEAIDAQQQFIERSQEVIAYLRVLDALDNAKSATR